MGLAEQQKALALLYTDAGLRERFFLDPLDVITEIGLKEDEAKKLAEVSKDELLFFSESLVWKRLNEISKLLPLVRKALCKDFDKIFFEFSLIFNPTGIKKHLEDAIAFCEYLETRIEKGWRFDLIRYEKSLLEFDGLNRKFLLRRFNFDLREVFEKLPQENKIDVVKRKIWFGVWLRLGKKHFIRISK